MNKFKKFLALGLIGVTTFTGCSLTSEQQSSIDKLVSKTDELTKVIEKQNSKLSREDAVRQIKSARRSMQAITDGELKISIEASSFDDVFGKPLSKSSQTLSVWDNNTTHKYSFDEIIYTDLITNEVTYDTEFIDNDYTNNVYFAGARTTKDGNFSISKKTNYEQAQSTRSAVPDILSNALNISFDDIDEDSISNVYATEDGYQCEAYLENTWLTLTLLDNAGYKYYKGKHYITFTLKDGDITNIHLVTITNVYENDNQYSSETNSSIIDISYSKSSDHTSQETIITSAEATYSAN